MAEGMEGVRVVNVEMRCLRLVPQDGRWCNSRGKQPTPSSSLLFLLPILQTNWQLPPRTVFQISISLVYAFHVWRLDSVIKVLISRLLARLTVPLVPGRDSAPQLTSSSWCCFFSFSVQSQSAIIPSALFLRGSGRGCRLASGVASTETVFVFLFQHPNFRKSSDLHGAFMRHEFPAEI